MTLLTQIMKRLRRNRPSMRFAKAGNITPFDPDVFWAAAQHMAYLYYQNTGETSAIGISMLAYNLDSGQKFKRRCRKLFTHWDKRQNKESDMGDRPWWTIENGTKGELFVISNDLELMSFARAALGPPAMQASLDNLRQNAHGQPLWSP